jgi:hypothetical protein
MLQVRRISATAVTAVALCAPATASADDWFKTDTRATPNASYAVKDARMPDTIEAARRSAEASEVDLVSPDARDAGRVKPPAPPRTRIVEVPTTGFEWGDAAIGGAATLALILTVAAGGMTVRPRRQVMRTR